VRGAAWIVTVAAAASAPACFLPSFEVETNEGGAGAGGSGSGGSACESATVAPPPTDAPPGGQFDVFTATHTIDLGETHIDDRPGLDLDGACTCCAACDAAPTCAPSASAPEAVCDEVDGISNAGIDNDAAKLFAAFAAGFPGAMSTPILTTQIGLGTFGIVIRLFHYNGETDDDTVSVAVYGTLGATQPPTWTGNDAWRIRDDSLAMGFTSIDDALSLRDDAYVTGGVLVARFDTTPLVLFLANGLVVRLQDGLLTARVEKVAGGGFRLLDGTIGGTWSEGEVFAGFAGLEGADARTICTTNPSYESSFKGPLCELRDALSGGGAASAPCDAISFGMAFTADPIAGNPVIATPPMPLPACDMTMGDPTTDACAKL